MKFKIGVIGCGGIANNKHLPALEKREDIEIAAFCDIKKEQAEETRARFRWKNAEVYTDYRQVLKKNLDAVYVLTPNNMHCSITVEALESGKHVLCEKPMAITATDAEKMVEAAEKTGKILTIGYQNRYRPDAQYLKQVCSNQELGEIYFAKAHALRRRAVPNWGVFLDKKCQGGGALIDIGTHALDLTLWMMDNYSPVSVTGSVYRKLGNQTSAGNLWGDWDRDAFQVEDAAVGFVKMKNGATIVVEASWALNILDGEEAKTTLCGTKAGADMKEGLRINSIKYERQMIEKPDFYSMTEQTENEKEQEIFLNAISGTGSIIVKPREAYVVTRILEAIYQSAQSGKTIYFENESRKGV